jgi:hypothetical protein
MAYGYDPSNPNTALINGQYYVWQPSTQGADASAYLGANADPALVNQDTSPESGNGQWVPGTYDNPNGSFLKLLAEMVGGTSAAEFALPYLLGGSAAAGAAGAGTGSATGAGSTIAPLTTTTLSGIPPGLSTVSLPAAGAGGSTLTKNIVDNGKNVVDNNTKDKVKTGSSALPSWVKPSIVAAAPIIGKLFGGGASDLTNSLSNALTGLVPDLQKSFELGMQRQTQAQPLYDAVLKMALGRLPNWSTGGGE